jgi:hypothetical protein
MQRGCAFRIASMTANPALACGRLRSDRRMSKFLICISASASSSEPTAVMSNPDFASTRGSVKRMLASSSTNKIRDLRHLSLIIGVLRAPSGTGGTYYTVWNNFCPRLAGYRYLEGVTTACPVLSQQTPECKYMQRQGRFRPVYAGRQSVLRGRLYNRDQQTRRTDFHADHSAARPTIARNERRR